LVTLLLGFLATLEEKVSKIGGIWTYRVTFPNGDFSHSGRCELIQKGASLRIYGHRYIQCQSGGMQSCQYGDWNWDSTWGEVAPDGYVRFDYEINVAEDDHVTAICKLRLHGTDSMSGTYHRLPPFPSPSVNAKWGNIYFEKLTGPEAALTRPRRGYDAVGNEI
jgi:hypothetical protein